MARDAKGQSVEPWRINTARIAEKILEAAKQSHTEEDLKMRVEPILQGAFEQIGVDVEIVRYEKRAGFGLRGRADAVYGYLYLEYKAPCVLGGAGGIRKATQELERYLREESQQSGSDPEAFLEKAVGVATDGQQIFFIRYSRTTRLVSPPVPVREGQSLLFPEMPAKAGFHMLGPYPVSASSLANLLIFVRAAGRRPLTATDLAAVFGPTSPIAQRAVSSLYSMLVRAQRRQVPSRIKAFFLEWDRMFGVIYGQNLAKAEKSAEEAGAHYSLAAGVRLKPLLFSIHTYCAFLMKLIAIELASLQKASVVESFVRGLSALEDEAFKERLIHLESGADFIHQGIENFLEADFFSWYLDGWDPQIANVFRDMIRALSDFEPATPVLEPEWTKDLLQNLYEAIVPQELRHDLGEYYTPDWLAGYVVEKSGYTGDPNLRFLDPACGSGTFLVQAIDRVLKRIGTQKKVDMTEIGGKILENIVGFDMNPLAVLAARTNYLIAFSKFVPFVRPVVIPVYLCDSVLAPTRYEEEGELPLEDAIVFRTTKCDYKFPVSVQTKENIDRFTSKVDVALRSKIKPPEFEKQLRSEFKLPENDLKLLSEVYQQLKKLDDNKENGFWAKYIKNAFAPAFLDEFDFVIGNPPWIRWDFLSDDYRKATLNLWQRYGLFSLKGYEGRLGGGKKDFSMLFTYACADQYLKDDGILGFVITMEVFKSKGAGEGFRRFKIGRSGADLKIMGMEDMVDLKPFAAANKTSIFLLKKGEKTIYPVPSVEWGRKKGIGRILPRWNLEKVLAASERRQTRAIPVNPDKITSAWQTAPTIELKRYQQVKGKNPYRARLGVNADPYGIFWLKVAEVRPDKKLVVENLFDRGKSDIRSVKASLESDLIYPAVTGGDIVKFGIKSNFHILVTQDPEKRQGYDEDHLSLKYPLTYAYLVQFRDFLLKRALYRKYFYRNEKPFAPFYSQFNVSKETFAKYRVTWKVMASKMSAVVLSTIKTDFGMKPIISTKVTSFIPTDNKPEAHYLCAILNSQIVNDFISSFSAAGRGFGTPSVMENLAIPKFDPENKLHTKLSERSSEAHQRAGRGASIEDIDREIDELARKLWNIRS